MPRPAHFKTKYADTRFVYVYINVSRAGFCAALPCIKMQLPDPPWQQQRALAGNSN